MYRETVMLLIKMSYIIALTCLDTNCIDTVI